MTDSLGQKFNYRSDAARAHVGAAARPSARMMVKESPVYDGRESEILRIVSVNLILNFMTLGLYRFWAKTRLRRYFLSRIAFLGDRFEYTGTGKELFVGFLIVLAILAPVGVVFQFLSHYAVSQGLETVVIVQTAYALMFYFLIQIAVYRAQRYRLSRTSWRGIRGGQSGSAILYALFAMMWSVITLITLGLAYPLMRRSLQGYKINNARFGDESFHFEGGAGALCLAWILPWTGLALVVAAFALVGVEQRGTGPVDWEQAMQDPKQLLQSFGYWQLLLGGFLLFWTTLFWYRAAELRYFASRTVFDELRFTSTFKGIQIFLIYIAYLILMLLVVLGAGALFFAASKVFIGANSWFLQTVVSAAVIIPALLLLGALQPLIVQNFLVRVFCNSLIAQGTFSPERLLQNQLDIPRRGEGLADALDIDAF